MMNSLDVYAEAGRRAGQARNQHDESRAKFQSDWAKRAIALEQDPEYRIKARAAFDAAYTEARNITVGGR